MGYLWGIGQAVVGGARWSLSLAVAYIFGIAIVGDYPKVRDAINSWQSVVVMPADFPMWWIVVPLLAWVVARLAHREAMRYWRAARLCFDKPYVEFGPLYAMIGSQRTILHHFYMAKVNIRNEPYKADDGRDVDEAWSQIEVFDAHHKKLAEWRDARWEENKQPGYGDHPRDHYPADQKVRCISANGRPNILCVAYKPIDDDFAYPIRGEDQLKPGWRSTDVQIPSGDYLLRVRIRGKGLQEAAERVFALSHRGRGSVLQLEPTDKKIGTQWV